MRYLSAPYRTSPSLFRVNLFTRRKNKIYISFLIKEDIDGGKPYQKRQLKNYAGFLAIFNIT